MDIRMSTYITKKDAMNCMMNLKRYPKGILVKSMYVTYD
uniref:Uncharacterized protein n=1 Tax=Anguilla anguilla TaxID=7936 RepID=A0A0E9RTK3_ANGAN